MVRYGGGRAAATTLAVGIVLLVVALVATLSHATVRSTGSNHLHAFVDLGAPPPGRFVCQRGELVPHGTGAVRAFVVPAVRSGPAVEAVVLRDGVVVARGARTRGWSGTTVTVGLAPVPGADGRREVCLRFAAGERVGVVGQRTVVAAAAASVGGRPVTGRLRLAYLRPRAESWWTFAPTVVARMGFGHALRGAAIPLLVLVLVLTSIGLALWQLVRADG